jgi:N-acetylmuramoyl-L-alanine amidase
VRPLIRLVLAVILVLPTLPAPAQQASGAVALTIVMPDGRRTLPLTTIGGRDYVSIDELAGVFALTAREDQLAGGMTLTSAGRTIVLTADQPVVSVAGRLVSLPAPPVRQGARWLVPLEFLPQALGLVYPQRLDLRRASRLLVVGDLRVPRVVTRIQAGATGAQVTFEISPSTPAQVTAQNGQLVVQFDADAIDLSAPALPPQTFLLAVAPGDAPATVRLATGPRFSTHRTTTVPADAGSSRLVIDLMPAGTVAPAAPEPAPVPAEPAPVPPLLAPAPATGVRTIVIDPGHGGDELGAQGPAGTLEKNVTLAVARRLRTLIETRLGLRVLLTRDDDRTLGLDERAALANNNRADLFISIHANAAVRAGMRGAEVYFLSLDRASREAQLVGASDTRLPVLGGGTRAIDLILWEAAQARHLEQSSTLAAFVEQTLRGRVEMSPNAVQQAPFRVLVGANMPAVLVEIGYLSNAEQEKALASAAYQDQVALALYDAVARFRDYVGRGAAAGQEP